MNQKKSTITDKLYPIDIFIYNRIKYFNKQKNNACFESNKSLSDAIGRSIPRISRSVNKLIKLGYVKNKGSAWARQMYITDKQLKQTLNLTDMSLNKNDKTINLTDKGIISEMLITLYKTDKALLTKAIRDFNKSDNIVKENKRLELIDIVKDNNTVKEKNEPFLRIVLIFKKLIEEFKGRTLTGKSFNQDKWCDAIRLLQKDIGEERMLSALDWYAENIGKKYVPECYSAVSFREKFEKIESAMERGKR